MKKFKKFAIIVISIAILIIIALIIILIAKGSNSDTTSSIVQINGDTVSTYSTESAAAEKCISLEVNGDATSITVDTDKNVDISIRNQPVTIDKLSENEFSADFNSIVTNEIAILKISIGGDGSFIGKAFDEEITVYYVGILIINNNPTDTTAPLPKTISNGFVYFSEEENQFETYSSEEAAQQVAQEKGFTLPKQFIRHGLKIKFDPNETKCCRIFVRICMLDNDFCDTNEIRINADSNWTGTMNLDQYQGHQLTLRIKFENNNAVVTDYKYISFYVPNLS